METIIVGSAWPEGISDGLTLPCQRCGAVPRFDYRVSDECWRRVVPPAWNLGVVCLPCLDALGTARGVDVAAHLEFVQYTGLWKTVVLRPEKVYYYPPDGRGVRRGALSLEDEPVPMSAWDVPAWVARSMARENAKKDAAKEKPDVGAQKKKETRAENNR